MGVLGMRRGPLLFLASYGFARFQLVDKILKRTPAIVENLLRKLAGLFYGKQH
jgi:hypothetical protein